MGKPWGQLQPQVPAPSLVLASCSTCTTCNDDPAAGDRTRVEVSNCLFYWEGGGIGSRHRNPPPAVCTSPWAGNFWVLQVTEGRFQGETQPLLRSGCWTPGSWPQQLRIRKAPQAFPKGTRSWWGGLVHEMAGDFLAFKALFVSL